MKKGMDLIHEINNCMLDTASMAFWWLGQLGFVVKLGDAIIYLDPFISEHPDRKIPPLLKASEVTNADYIIGSHDHLDHIDREVWHQLSLSSPAAKFVVPKLLIPTLSSDLTILENRFIGLDDGVSFCHSNQVTISGIAAAHEFFDQNEDTGEYPYLGFVIEGNGCILYHSGDTCIYEGMLNKLRKFGTFDVMFLPINGRDGRRYASNIIGNMTYQEAVDLAGTLKPNLVVPAHYEMFDSNREDPLLFADYMNAKFPKVHYWIGKHGEMVQYCK
ncbi:MAG: MBL fold metallo-hydrolase [Velocimicrobium sp.]